MKRLLYQNNNRWGKEDEKKIYHILDNDNGIIFNADRLLRDELRLGGHDGLAGGGLRELVVCALTLEIVGDVRDNQGVHQSCDECRFAGTHRAYDTEINVAASPACDVRIN